jgi:hypothetical protein
MQLNFKGNDTNFVFSSPLLLMLLNQNGTVASLSCAYPLSGQYDHLTRWLFYAALIAAILFRRKPIIANTALASVMTYSTLSALHLFVLLGQYKFKEPADWWFSDKSSIPGWDDNSAARGGDVDFFGIMPVVTTTSIMLTPILTWSTTFRSTKARALIVWWAIFIFASIIPFYFLEDSFNTKWSIDTLPGIAFRKEKCSLSAPVLSTWEQYNECGCADFCGLYSPSAPLRSRANMFPLLVSRFSRNIIFKEPNNYTDLKLNGTYANLVLTVFVFWGMAILLGAFAILQSFSSLSNTRNYIFRAISSPRRSIIILLYRGRRRQRHLDKIRSKASFLRRPRLILAKYVAALYYFLSVLGMFVYPVFFVLTAFFCEVIIGTASNSEHSDAIGAWAPWAAAALVIIGTLIIDYHGSAVDSLGKLISKPLHQLQYDRTERPTSRPGDSIWSRISMTFGDLKAHSTYSLRSKMWAIRKNNKEFQDWWRDPEERSYIDEG